MAAFWHSFFNDTRVQTILLLVALDLLLGVAASLKAGNFRLSFVADFARNDLLGKVLPFAVLYAGYKYAGNADIVIPGFDMQVVVDAAWVIVLAALVGSLAGSLTDFGLKLPSMVAGPDPATPIIPPTTPPE
jgi:membrane protein YqaA with SNARE-associated domain